MTTCTTLMKRSAASVLTLASLTAALIFSASAHAARPCPPDIDCSGAVNVNDLLSVINGWGGTGAADVTGDGVVNVNDLLSVINAWGPCVLDFGPAFANTEAHQIGLEMGGPNGPLTLTTERYDRIVADLAQIRSAHPALASQTHSMKWLPNQMLVSVPNVLDADYLCLNTYYRVTNVEHLFSTWYVLTFAGKLNVERLAQIYMSSPAISFAEPNGLIGGQNFWVPSPQGNGIWEWNIDDGFHDCFDGCDCHYYYTLRTQPPAPVELLSYAEVGAPWCDFSGPPQK